MWPRQPHSYFVTLLILTKIFQLLFIVKRIFLNTHTQSKNDTVFTKSESGVSWQHDLRQNLTVEGFCIKYSMSLIVKKI